jgi:hypothetical protein
VTVALAHAATVQADVDLTGNWLLVLSLPGISIPVTIVQNGTSLSVSGGASVPTATGTIDPATGAFSVASSSPACNDLTLQGVAAPDGNSMSGMGTLEAQDAHGFCDALPFTFTGARALCPPGLAPRDTDGDGIADACDVCPASTPATRPHLRLGTYDGVAGNDKLSLRAGFAVSSAAAAFLDPPGRGLEIVIGPPEEFGELDLTVPPGPGWTTSRSGRVWKFRSADPSLAVSRVRVQLFAGTAPRVQVTASGKDASFAGTLPTTPLALHLVLDPPAITSSACGAVTFAGPGSDSPRCEVRSRGTTLVCR